MVVLEITGNENVNIVYRAYIRHKWINLRQTRTEIISDQFYTYRRIHFTSKIA